MTLFSMLGSSPRMRGAHVSPGSFEFLKGIIPAYAGSTGATTAQPILVRDHPRVCGEHSTFCTRTMDGSGSSPRMRGAL